MNIDDIVVEEKPVFNKAVPPTNIDLSPPVTVQDQDGRGNIHDYPDAASYTSTDYEIVFDPETSLESSCETSDSEDDQEKDENLIAWKSSDCRYEL